jgi:hypothetical protein
VSAPILPVFACHGFLEKYAAKLIMTYFDLTCPLFFFENFSLFLTALYSSEHRRVRIVAATIIPAIVIMSVDGLAGLEGLGDVGVLLEDSWML